MIAVVKSQQTVCKVIINLMVICSITQVIQTTLRINQEDTQQTVLVYLYLKRDGILIIFKP